MASDSNIDRAIGRLSPRRLASSSSSRSTSPRHNTNSTTTTAPPDLLPGHHRPGRLHIHGRTRSLSISSRASGFSHEDLVRPTLTFADDQDSLMALPPPTKLAPNQSVWKRITHVHHYPAAITLPLTCLSIALNALTANGPYVWPTYGPIVIERLGLSVTQGSTIALGGVLGTYLGAAPLGRFSDKKGPRAASLLSAVLSFVGYQSFALILTCKDRFPGSSIDGLDPDDNTSGGSSPLPILLALSYFCLGGAAIGAYFSSLTTAALQFPRYPTLALSLPLSCYGLSSLTLSSIARSSLFGDDETGQLDPIRLTRFLGVLVPCINLFASIWLFVSSAAVETYPDDPNQVQDVDADEGQPLLSSPGVDADNFSLDDQDVGDVSFAHSTRTNTTIGADAAPDLSASLHRELEDHGLRRSRRDQQHLAVGRLTTTASNHRVASIASSIKIVDPNEHTPLLIGGPGALYASVVEETASIRARLASRPPTILEAEGDADPEGKVITEGQVDWDFKSLGMNRGLWAFGTVMLLGMGPAEMVLSNIGSIANSLSDDYNDADRSLVLRSHLVLLLSVSSTVARLVTGVLVDYLSPVSPVPGSRRRTVDRSILAAGCLVVLAGALLWGALGIRSVDGLDLLSIGVGGMYGAVFTITPAVTSRHFGPGHFGLAWGMVSYFVAAGAIFFSYLYAFISEYQGGHQSRRRSPGTGEDDDDGRPRCQGTMCFEITFWVSSVSCLMAAIGMIWLGKRWKL